MTWEDIMRRVLPPIGGVVPHVTDAGAYGAGAEQGRKPLQAFLIVASISIISAARTRGSIEAIRNCARRWPAS